MNSLEVRESEASTTARKDDIGDEEEGGAELDMPQSKSLAFQDVHTTPEKIRIVSPRHARVKVL